MALGGRGLPRRGCASCHRATLPHKKYRVASEALDAEPVDYLADVTDKTIRQHGHRLTTLRANATKATVQCKSPRANWYRFGMRTSTSPSCNGPKPCTVNSPTYVMSSKLSRTLTDLRHFQNSTTDGRGTYGRRIRVVSRRCDFLNGVADTRHTGRSAGGMATPQA
jgi:hypothetical protein